MDVEPVVDEQPDPHPEVTGGKDLETQPRRRDGLQVPRLREEGEHLLQGPGQRLFALVRKPSHSLAQSRPTARESATKIARAESGAESGGRGGPPRPTWGTWGMIRGVTKRMRRGLAVFALLILTLAPAVPADFPGLRYESRAAAGPLSIHILHVDPRRVRIEAVRALDDGVGRETVSSMAERKAALAAVNGGFFRIGGRYDGEPAGILRVGGRWFSDPAGARGAIGWNARGTRIGRVGMKWWLRSRGRTFPVNGINRPRGRNEAILYDWAFHRTTLTDPGGLEFLIAGNRVAAVSRKGNSAIPPGGYVYSVGPGRVAASAGLKTKAPVRLGYELTAAGTNAPGAIAWREANNIVGGLPVLLSGGRRAFEPDQEGLRPGFAVERHPRTAVGLKADGTWVLVAVDGRQPGLSIGASLAELADLLQSLDCVDALNLDGGGSTTLFYDGAVVNSPSDGKERPVSDSIVILRK